MAVWSNEIYTGSGELTIYDPEIFTVVAGPGTTYIKSPWYDMLYPLIALNSIREKEGYAPRRNLWDNAFKSRGIYTKSIQITPTLLQCWSSGTIRM